MKFLKKYLFLAFVTLCSVVWIKSFSQQNINSYIILAQQQSNIANYDSSLYYLNKALNLAEESKNQDYTSYLNKLLGTDYIYLGQFDTALVYLNKSRILAEKLENDTILINANLNIGFVMFKYGKSDSAEFIYNRSLRRLEKIADTAGIAKAYNLLTILYKYTSDFEKGLETALKSSFYFKKLNKTQSYIRSLINLGNMYEKLGDYDTAYSCFQICHDLSVEHNNPSQALTALINMAVIDYNMGIDAKNNYDQKTAERKFLKSKESYLKAIEFSKEKNDKQTLALCYVNMSKLSMEFKQYQDAIDYSNEALASSIEIGDMIRQIDALINLGISNTNIKNYQEAISYFSESLELSKQSKYKQDQKNSLEYLSLVSEMMEDYKSALNYHRQAVIIQDSILNEEKIHAIKESEAKYELIHLRDQNRIKDLEKRKIRFERNLSFIVGVIIIFLLILIIVFFRMRARKNRIIAQQRIQKLEDEKKLMAARSVLVGQEKERERIAQELHDGIGVLLSTASIHFSSVESKTNKETSEMLKKANKLLKEAGKEVRQISHNMMPGVLSKFGLREALEDLFEDVETTGDIKVNLQLTCGDSRLPENMEIMIFRIVQEMLNNTLKHAKASKVSLLISRDDNEIFLDYTDDGIGFDEEKLPHGKNIGLSGIRSRVEYLGGMIKLTSSEGNGTRYAITIPLSEKIN